MFFFSLPSTLTISYCFFSSRLHIIVLIDIQANNNASTFGSRHSLSRAAGQSSPLLGWASMVAGDRSSSVFLPDRKYLRQHPERLVGQTAAGRLGDVLLGRLERAPTIGQRSMEYLDLERRLMSVRGGAMLCCHCSSSHLCCHLLHQARHARVQRGVISGCKLSAYYPPLAHTQLP